MPTATLDKLINGSLIENGLARMLHGDKVVLDPEAEKQLLRVERAKDLLLTHKHNNKVVFAQLKNEYSDLSEVYVYQILNAAKHLYALYEKFDPLYELMVMKERVDHLYSLAEKNDCAKFAKAASDLHVKWFDRYQREMERQKPTDDKHITYVFSMDVKLLGISDEKYAEWKEQFSELEKKALSKYGHELEDVEYETINTKNG
jgi:hypothetical protein